MFGVAGAAVWAAHPRQPRRRPGRRRHQRGAAINTESRVGGAFPTAALAAKLLCHNQYLQYTNRNLACRSYLTMRRSLCWNVAIDITHTTQKSFLCTSVDFEVAAHPGFRHLRTD